ncbi:outer membrane protein assembly factor BamB family protein [Gimesia maris]|uniref:Outer membrane biogenesis protein BamB n=1 Tax=Gimesia maris TaxID=122 RepID=A0ABX5YG23_9PLAN|nr:PQQ-binding-like beta-propeller repeat protein [Gimesia maris]QDU12711.1 outer membrane biogenesis protein BamB [Gimesia maris]QEG14648.1 outer membrane biogenesis protein BamB [Gimesia maris]QGQ31948.1 PQQ-binding-like beta-propeller repeat protein [Gimesia maris]
MQILRGCIALFVWGVFSFSTEIGRAQPEPQVKTSRFRESVSLDVNNTVLKKMGSVRDYLSEQQWEDAVKILIQISDEYGDSLYPESAGRYLRVSEYCQNLLAGFPPEAIAIYREKVDPRAKRWYEEALANSSEQPLVNIAEQALMSSYGDDALNLLGELAWEQGQLAEARSCWRKLIPRTASDSPVYDAGLFHYPDTDLPVPEILARLILVSFFEGNFSQADFEYRQFRKKFPETDGKLAGKEGNLSALLAEILADHSQVSLPANQGEIKTFAGHQSRNFKAAQQPDIGAIAWRFPVPMVWSQEFTAKPAFGLRVPPGLFPVVHQEHVFFNDAERIYGLNWKTGLPAWSQGQESSPILYPSDSHLVARLPFRPVVGVPRYTSTIAGGRLYARMGSPVTSVAKDERLGLFSDLVCLDLNQGQGKLLWKISSAQLREQNFVWSFEGAPVVSGNRLYVVLHRGFPEVQTNVACFSADTGEMIWNQKVCLALRSIEEGVNYISHLLLTLGEDHLYLSTDMGAIASLDTVDGKLNWLVTYSSEDKTDRDEMSNHMKTGLVPCLYDRGILFAAPQDSSQLMAFDAESGLLLWQREWPEQIRNLLGVTPSTLVVSGNRLFGLDRATGRINWKTGYHDPEGFGYGRGILAGQYIYWPLREEILVVHTEQGYLKQKISLRKHYGESGGNLVIAGNQLLVAQPRRLTAFGTDSRIPVDDSKNVSALNVK